MEGNLEGLHDPNWQTRRQIVENLAKTDQSALPHALVEILRQEHQDLEAVSAALQMLRWMGRRALPELARLMAAPDSDTRLYAALALGELGDEQAADILLASLNDPDPNVCFNVVEALGKLRASQAVDALLQLLNGDDMALTFAAIHALGEIGDPAAQPALLPLLQNPFYAEEIVIALGQLGDVHAVGPLLGWLESPEGAAPTFIIALTRIAKRSLEMSSPAVPGSQELPEQVLRQMAQHLGDTGRQRLLELLNFLDVDPLASLNAARATDDLYLQTNICPDCLPEFADLLGWLLVWPEGDRVLPHEAVLRQLGRLLLISPARRAAARALAQGQQAAIHMLTARLSDDDPEIRRAVMEALVESSPQDADALAALNHAFEAALVSGDPELACLAAYALGRSGDPQAIELLLAGLGNPSAQVRQTALKALQALSLPDLPQRLAHLLSDPDPVRRESALTGLALLGREAVNQHAARVFTALADPSSQVRRAAVEALPLVDDPQAGQALREVSQDPDPSLRAATARSLAQAGPELALPILHAALKDSHTWTRLYACRSLAHHARPESLPYLIEVVNDPMPPLRIVVAEALAHTLAPQAEAALQSLLFDPEPEVRQAAAQGLEQQKKLRDAS